MRAAWLTALAFLAALPTSALARTYLCFFFDAGSAEIGPRCQTIVIEIAELLRMPPPRSDPFGIAAVPSWATQVELTGHADAAEASRGKASLGRARAGAVAALLRANGVHPDRVKVPSFGATRPLASATGAGPQNRRVESRYE